MSYLKSISIKISNKSLRCNVYPIVGDDSESVSYEAMMEVSDGLYRRNTYKISKDNINKISMKNFEHGSYFIYLVGEEDYLTEKEEELIYNSLKSNIEFYLNDMLVTGYNNLQLLTNERLEVKINVPEIVDEIDYSK